MAARPSVLAAGTSTVEGKDSPKTAMYSTLVHHRTSSSRQAEEVMVEVEQAKA